MEELDQMRAASHSYTPSNLTGVTLMTAQPSTGVQKKIETERSSGPTGLARHKQSITRTTMRSEVTFMTKADEQVQCDHHIREEEATLEQSESVQYLGGSQNTVNLLLKSELNDSYPVFDNTPFLTDELIKD